MVKRIQAKSDSEDIASAFGNEDEFNDSLAEYCKPLEYDLGIQLRNTEREVSTNSGWIDILAEPYGSESDLIVIESQIGELDDDHVSRGYKYAIEQKATVLIYIADEFSPITRKQLNRIGENDDEMYIFGFIPSITNSDGDSVTMGFTRAVSPSDWEEYRDRTLPSGLDEDRTIIFEQLETELEQQNIAELKRNNPVPTHSGYYESEPNPIDEFDVYYSVRQRVTKQAQNGDDIGNITFNLRTGTLTEDRVSELIESNSELLDDSYSRWNFVPDWNSIQYITISSDIDPANHSKVVDWFVEQRKILSQIEDELSLSG